MSSRDGLMQMSKITNKTCFSLRPGFRRLTNLIMCVSDNQISEFNHEPYHDVGCRGQDPEQCSVTTLVWEQTQTYSCDGSSCQGLQCQRITSAHVNDIDLTERSESVPLSLEWHAHKQLGAGTPLPGHDDADTGHVDELELRPQTVTPHHDAMMHQSSGPT